MIVAQCNIYDLAAKWSIGMGNDQFDNSTSIGRILLARQVGAEFGFIPTLRPLSVTGNSYVAELHCLQPT